MRERGENSGTTHDSGLCAINLVTDAKIKIGKKIIRTDLARDTFCGNTMVPAPALLSPCAQTLCFVLTDHCAGGFFAPNMVYGVRTCMGVLLPIMLIQLIVLRSQICSSEDRMTRISCLIKITLGSIRMIAAGIKYRADQNSIYHIRHFS